MVMPLFGKIKPMEIEEEMQRSYLDYAMSVIVGRALPDVRDGLKPVHRRILYGMYEQSIYPNRPHRKSARVVGDVMGKYHPHGDSAIYDAMVRMAQDFSTRYELVDGHGNFGSTDGDSAAAMRYTEARLSPISMELLSEIDKNTVDFIPNYDESMQEPVVLPARYPNLLVNGSSGIAVGMATNIPPHNLGEVVDAAIALLENPGLGPDQLLQYVKGPDFPTGGIIMGMSGIHEAYTTGKGILHVRGRAHIEQAKSGKNSIVVTELPYQVNKARLAERIAELVREKKMTGISDLRDESDRAGTRLVVELKREATPQVVLNQLYKHTQLQESFGIIMLAIVGGVPRTMNLAEVLGHYLEHRVEVVERRTRFDLEKALARAHILEGLLIALDHIDEVIATIRASSTVEEARGRLMEKFGLSEIQSQAILDMRLQRLTGLERQKVKDEYDELQKEIAFLRSVLEDPAKLRGIIRDELNEVRQKYADERRTEIHPELSDLDIEDLIAEEEVIVTITHSGYIKRLPVATYRKQHRGGRGIAGTNLKEGDFVEHLFVGSTHHFLHFFSNQGKVYRLKVYEIPEASRTARGQALVNLLPLGPGEKICSIVSTRTYEKDQFLIIATRRGMVKKTYFTEYDSPRQSGLIAIVLREGDEVIDTRLISGDSNILFATREGYAIKFSENDCRPLSRATQGVRAINLGDEDRVVAMGVAREDADLLVITDYGYGKRTAVSKYPLQRRGGKGVRTIQYTPVKGKVAGAKCVKENQELLAVSSEGVIIRVSIEGINRMGRSTQGVKVMNMRDGDSVAAIAMMVAEDEREMEGSLEDGDELEMEDSLEDGDELEESLEADGPGEV
jgi:DNA gyrase subunit A